MIFCPIGSIGGCPIGLAIGTNESHKTFQLKNKPLDCLKRFISAFVLEKEAGQNISGPKVLETISSVDTQNK